MLINSDRRFGVEIEFYAPTREAIMYLMREFHVKNDGSLTAKPNGGELVTQPLIGKSGENTIRDACAALKKNSCESGDPTTSVHVHLDGRRTGYTIEKVDKPKDSTIKYIAVSRRVQKFCTDGQLNNILKFGTIPFIPEGFIQRTVLDNVVYYALTTLTRHPKLNYDYYIVKKDDRFDWIKNVFYFYTKYSDVMEALVSNSRKMGNMYCIPLGSSYDLSEIEKAKTMNELRLVWYKGRDIIEPHYDNSRYHNVNLHPFFSNRPEQATVEIRSLGGTIDADKILLWVRLHQFIVDKCENISLQQLSMSRGDNVYSSFLNFIKEDELLYEYSKRLLGYFSGIKI